MTLTHQFRRRWVPLLVCLWFGGFAGVVAENGPGVSEYQVKAVFLYNFIKFTEWPTNAHASAQAPTVIGIVGEDPFGRTIDEVIAGNTVRDRPLVVKRLRAGDDLRGCHVLFISRSETGRMAGLLNQVRGSPVLTVSDAPGFAAQGGMVSLLLVQRTVKMEINPEAAAAAGLQISSKLLKLAAIVKSGEAPAER